MSSLVGSMTNLGLSVFSDQLGIEKDTDGEYNAFIAEMKAAYDDVEAYDVATLEALASKVSRAYDNRGIALSDGVATCIALDMLDTLESGDEAEIKAFFKNSAGVSGLAVDGGSDVVLLASGTSTNSASLTIVSSIAAQADENITRDELKALIAEEFSASGLDLT